MQYILTEEEYKNLVPIKEYEYSLEKIEILNRKVLEICNGGKCLKENGGSCDLCPIGQYIGTGTCSKMLPQKKSNDKINKEYKVGESFQYGNVKLKVDKSRNEWCDSCFFYSDKGDCLSVFVCTKEQREDKTDVIFIKVED